MTGDSTALESTPLIANHLEGSLQETRAWEEHRKWTIVANKKRKEVDGMRNNALSLTVVGAALQALVTQVPQRFGSVISISGGICLGMVPIITRTYLNEDNILDRARSRTIAELLRGEVYKSLSRATPYSGNDEDRAATLKAKIAHIKNEHSPGDTLSNAVELVDDNKAFPCLKEQTLKSTYKDLYLVNRVKKEMDYRIKNSKQKFQLSNRYNQAEDFLSTLVGLSGVNGIVSGAININAKETAGMTIQGRVGVAIIFITTASLAVTAHVRRSNLEDLAAKLSYAANELKELQEDRLEKMKKNGEVETDEDWTKFVDSCEDTISSQTETWGDSVMKRAKEKN